MPTQFDEYFVLAGHARTRDEAIREAGDLLLKNGKVQPEYVESMFDRELSVSTYMGNHLAIPHGTYEAAKYINGSALAVIRYEKPIEWDGEPVNFVVGIAGKDDSHLIALGRLAEIFSETETVNQLLAASTLDQMVEIFHQDAA
ncbi:MAG: hypothetical protein RL196_1483 [Actinomycetota bacterium]|jgi:PTS system mannitol-specific IIA component